MEAASFLALLWVFSPAIAALIAGLKSRSIIGWFFLGLLFGPVALLLIILMPSFRMHASVHVHRDDDRDDDRDVREPRLGKADKARLNARRATKLCPDCAEEILADARLCRHCGFRFDAPAVAAPQRQIEAQQRRPEEPAVTCLLALEDAGTSSNEDGALNAVLDYIHDTLPKGIQTAAEQNSFIHWITSVTTDEPSLRRAFGALRDSGVDRDAFKTACARIITATGGPSERQSKLMILFDKLLTGQPVR